MYVRTEVHNPYALTVYNACCKAFSTPYITQPLK